MCVWRKSEWDDTWQSLITPEILDTSQVSDKYENSFQEEFMKNTIFGEEFEIPDGESFLFHQSPDDVIRVKKVTLQFLGNGRYAETVFGYPERFIFAKEGKYKEVDFQNQQKGKSLKVQGHCIVQSECEESPTELFRSLYTEGKKEPKKVQKEEQSICSIC